MMLFRNPMMDDEPAAPGGNDDPAEPTVETLKKNLEDLGDLTDNGPGSDFPVDVTGNAINEYRNDHFVVTDPETMDPTSDSMIITNHNYILAGDPGVNDAAVKTAYDAYDAAQMAAVTYNMPEEESEEPEEPGDNSNAQ